MDIAKEVATWLEAMTSFTLGTDLYIGNMPVNIQKGLMVRRIGGSLDDYVPLEHSLLEINVKDTSSETAIETLEDIKRSMHRMIDTQTGNAQIYSMLVADDIEDSGRDFESAKMYRFTVDVHHRSLSIIS